MTAPGALLDIDGTLLDTNHLHAVAWWRAFRRFDLTFPMHRIHALIGMGGDQLVPQLVGHEVPGADDAWQEEFDRLFDDVSLLPGARELAQGLHASGLSVVLASSAPEPLLGRFCELLRIDEWLAGATSSSDADRSKPEADIFAVAMDRFGLDPALTIVVGDTIWDAEAARRAGIGFVAVETGGNHPDDLRRAGATRVYADPGAVAADLHHGPFAPLLAAAR